MPEQHLLLFPAHRLPTSRQPKALGLGLFDRFLRFPALAGGGRFGAAKPATTAGRRKGRAIRLNWVQPPAPSQRAASNNSAVLPRGEEDDADLLGVRASAVANRAMSQTSIPTPTITGRTLLARPRPPEGCLLRRTARVIRP